MRLALALMFSSYRAIAGGGGGTPETLTDGDVSAVTLTDGATSGATLEDRS